ncbi:MAG: hypothetical protein IT262_18105 [Saprospiraceae bacterium]|nr:hypothetical protein [Saprospiraceae bacterium]
MPCHICGQTNHFAN